MHPTAYAMGSGAPCCHCLSSEVMCASAPCRLGTQGQLEGARTLRGIDCRLRTPLLQGGPGATLRGVPGRHARKQQCAQPSCGAGPGGGRRRAAAAAAADRCRANGDSNLNILFPLHSINNGNRPQLQALVSQQKITKPPISQYGRACADVWECGTPVLEDDMCRLLVISHSCRSSAKLTLPSLLPRTQRSVATLLRPECTSSLRCGARPAACGGPPAQGPMAADLASRGLTLHMLSAGQLSRASIPAQLAGRRNFDQRVHER